jgi:uncharacterized protein
MSFTIVDRRINGKGKSLDNRQKFLKRVREAVKKALPDMINSRKIQDIAGDGGIVHIPQKNIGEPSFRHGQGGTRETVRPGNKEFNTGDRFRKPSGGQGQGGRKGSNSGSGEDDFTIQISREEFLDFFFEELELPDLTKENLKQLVETKYHNAGYSSTGSPAKLDRSKTLRQSQGRRITSRAPYKRKLKEAEAELAELKAMILPQVLSVTMPHNMKIAELEKKIEGYKRKIANVPFLDPVDLRYHSIVAEEHPITSAVMFCVMDNSGSMGEHEKTLSRKFFALLYMFLARKYEKITVRFISHTTEAKEVDEDEFFNTRESGGTMVSSALTLLNDIIAQDYGDGNTNIYVCQCSDGDNWYEDNAVCYDLLVDGILPASQYYAYIQVGQSSGYQSDIWETYKRVEGVHSHFHMNEVTQDADIYPVFKELFEKKV